MALKVFVDFQKWVGRMLHDGSIGMIEQSSAPGTPPANQLSIYPLDKSTVTELYYKNSGGTQRDLSLVAALTFGGTPSTIEVGDAAAEGASAQSARVDHEHAVTAPAAPANVTKAAAAAGSAVTVARSDHKHDITTAVVGSSAVGDSAAEGTATSLTRSDHIHGREAFGSPSGLANANTNGAGTTLVRSDHQHKRDIRVAKAGVDVGTRNRLNLIEGTNITLTVADDGVSDEIDITVDAAVVAGLTHQQVMARGLLRV